MIGSSAKFELITAPSLNGQLKEGEGKDMENEKWS